MISLIAARAKNNVIGRGADIPWKAKGEQKLFREITIGNTLIMGRKTFASIGHPLPERDTVVITRNRDFTAPGCHSAQDMEEAIVMADKLRGQPFIAGGGEIYQQAIDIVDIIHLTTVDTEVIGDIYFPEFDPDKFKVVSDIEYQSNINYRYQKLVRRPIGARV